MRLLAASVFAVLFARVMISMMAVRDGDDVRTV
jgi:hypothetical protein